MPGLRGSLLAAHLPSDMRGVVAGVILLILGACVQSLPSASPMAPSASAVPPSPDESVIASPPPMAIDFVGTTLAGDIWAIQRSTWLDSSDAGATWKAAALPLDASSVLTANALDADHAWLIGLGAGSTQLTGSPSDILNMVVERTADGGRTWQASAIPGNHAGHTPSLLFIDPLHGYLMLSAGRFSDGVSTVLESADGGASWSVAGKSDALGPLFAASDGTTLWAGLAQSAAGASPIDNPPLLEVSRDGGRSWQDAHLPLLEGEVGGGGAWLDGPPHFLDPATGIVTATALHGNGMETRVFRTTDAGRTWTLISDLAVEAGAGPALFDAKDWLLPLVNPFGLMATTDGGATWQPMPATGLANGGWIAWVGALDVRHAVALVPSGHSFDGSGLLFITADGGRTWQTPG